MQERAGCQRTFHDDRASSEEEEEQRTGCPPGKGLRNQFKKLLFRPPSPASSHMLAPEGRRSCTLAGGTQDARPERKERPARMQKSRF